METTLIQGRFPSKVAEELLSQLIQVKIRFHEEKIKTSYMTEEDIKATESRIRQLQHDLRSAREYVRTNPDGFFDLHCPVLVTSV
jgi:thermostable 8-oxoguanine DNA glycosylase